VGVSARGTGGAKEPAATKTPTPIGDAPEEESAEDVFLRSQRVLLNPGDVTLELGLSHARNDDQAFASTGGGVVLGAFEDDTFTTSLIARLGLFSDTEIFASIPYRRQTSQVFAGSQKIDGTVVTEFGDLRLGLRQSVVRERLGVPEIIVTVESLIPTHESSYALGGGVALVKSVDPAVLFANMNYRHTFSEDFLDVTRLAARDRIDASAGFAFALNDTLTLSAAASALFTSEDAFTNATLRNQESYSLQFGLTSLLTKGLYIEPTVSFGLNESATDVVLGVNFVYTFTPSFGER
jgi:hypothetical protein